MARSSSAAGGGSARRFAFRLVMTIVLRSLLMVCILKWNGKDLPEELRGLPPGQYALQPIDDLPELTDEEDEGLRQALASLRAGRGRTLDQVRQTVDAALER